MHRALLGGATYFGSVFLLGIALGTVRIFALVPRVGELAAVAIETPLMLLAAWRLCGFWGRRFLVSRAATQRLVMGGVAFVLLIAAELGLELAFGGSAATFLASYSRPGPLLGLAAQIAFAGFPWLSSHARARRRSLRCAA